MPLTDTAKQNEAMTTTPTTTFDWLRRHAPALFALLMLAGIYIAVLGVIHVQAQPRQASVGMAGPSVSSQPDARVYELQMNRLRDINEALAPAASSSQPDARAYELQMNRLRDINEALAPAASSSQPDARAYELQMNRLRELNTMDDPMRDALLPFPNSTQPMDPF